MPDNPLRIALVAPPMLPVPPPTYAGTERVVAALADELRGRGHDVTLYAPGDSTYEGELVETPDESLWSTGYHGDVSSFINVTIARVWAASEAYDIIHSHVETLGFLFARYCPTPVITTLHGRLDSSGIPELLEEFDDIPLVAISESQRRWSPGANWVATIHHGLPLDHMPFGPSPGDYLAFVGRVTPEKGIADCIEVARTSGKTLRMAAKVYDEHERQHFAEVVQPAIDDGTVEFLGELGPPERDVLYAGAAATLMLGAWPEPFGLVAIESMATGTPVVARRAGALTETIEHGVTGFLVDDDQEAGLALERVVGLDRAVVREKALERFSPARMADEYEAAYRATLSARRRDSERSGAAS
ncbi:MAG TPA: glycosyltransferase family 4 protein [Candidatus Limnocylindrales bacterium]|nr:glycosyltransferase family 4 protein [Candidatus Limnocylindrales bacterium]